MSQRIQEALGPVYAAAEFALEARRYAKECKLRNVPEDSLELVAEVAFQAMERLREAVGTLNETIRQSSAAGSEPPQWWAGLN